MNTSNGRILTNPQSDTQLQEVAVTLARQISEPMTGVTGFDVGAQIKPGFWDRQLIARARRDGLVSSARSWAEGQAKVVHLCAAARLEIARQGFQALVATQGAQMHAKAAALISQAERSFFAEIDQQEVEFVELFNKKCAFAQSQSNPKIRIKLEEHHDDLLTKFLANISARQDHFFEVTRRRIEELGSASK